MAPKARYPTVAPAHDTGRVAESILEQWLAGEWLVHPLAGTKDYGHDYVIEAIGETDGHRHPSGQVFLGQLKGVNGSDLDEKGCARVTLRTTTLRYYLERCELPVFLFIVDTTTRRGWFVFLQAYLSKPEVQGQLGTQETMSIPTRLGDRIDQPGRLGAAVADAMRMMRTRYPGSIDDVIEAFTKKYEAIDPRFHVRLDLSGGRKTMYFVPKAGVGLSFTARPEAVDRVVPLLDEMFRFGCPIELSSDDVLFRDFPHADVAIREGKRVHIAFEPGPGVEVDVVLRGGANDRRFDLRFPGVLHGGSVGFSFEARLKDCPLSLNLRLPRPSSEPGGESGRFETSWSFAPWEGRVVSSLPWLEQLAFFARAVVEKQPVAIEISAQGNRLWRGEIALNEVNDEFRELHVISDCLLKTRELARRRGITLHVPSPFVFAEGEKDGVDMALSLEVHRRFEGPTPNILLEFNDPEYAVNGGTREPPPGGSSGSVQAELLPLSIKVMGRMIEFGNAQADLSHVIYRRVPRGEDNGTWVSSIEGTPDTRMTITLIDAPRFGGRAVGAKGTEMKPPQRVFRRG